MAMERWKNIERDQSVVDHSVTCKWNKKILSQVCMFISRDQGALPPRVNLTRIEDSGKQEKP
jgi:hypothetical protein